MNDAYFKAVKTIESQAPRKKKPFKAVFGVGDATQHYYAEFVTPQQVVNQIDERLNNVISWEEHMALVEEQRKTTEEVNHLLSFVRTLFQQNSAFQQSPKPPPS